MSLGAIIVMLSISRKTNSVSTESLSPQARIQFHPSRHAADVFLNARVCCAYCTLQKTTITCDSRPSRFYQYGLLQGRVVTATIT